MTRIFEVDLSTDKIAEPLDAAAYRVNENRFVVARYTPERPYIITYGISACKGVVISSPEEQRGLVGHLSAGGNLEENLDRLVQGYESNLDEADVHVVRAIQSDPNFWPPIEAICEYFLQHNPRTLAIDNNPTGTQIRGIAINLADGRVSEIDRASGWTWSELQDTSLNQPIYQTVS